MLLLDVRGQGQSAGKGDVTGRAPMDSMVVDIVEVEATPRGKDGVAVDAQEGLLPVVVASVSPQVPDVRKVETALQTPEGHLSVLTGQFFRGMHSPLVEGEARFQPENLSALRTREVSARGLGVLRLQAVLLDPVDDLLDFAQLLVVHVVLFQVFHEHFVTVEHLVAVSAVPPLNDIIMLDYRMVLQIDEVVEAGLATFTDEENFALSLQDGVVGGRQIPFQFCQRHAVQRIFFGVIVENFGLDVALRNVGGKVFRLLAV